MGRLESDGVEWVSGVVQHAAGAADLLRLVVTSAGSTVLRGGVDAAALLLRVSACDADVAFLAVGRGPGVADQPVRLAVVYAVAHQHHCVVDVGVLLVAATVSRGDRSMWRSRKR